jgi:hypothetical protein
MFGEEDPGPKLDSDEEVELWLGGMDRFHPLTTTRQQYRRITVYDICMGLLKEFMRGRRLCGYSGDECKAIKCFAVRFILNESLVVMDPVYHCDWILPLSAAISPKLDTWNWLGSRLRKRCADCNLLTTKLGACTRVGVSRGMMDSI